MAEKSSVSSKGFKSARVPGRLEALLHPDCVDRPGALRRRQLSYKGHHWPAGRTFSKRAVSEEGNEVSSLARDQSLRRSVMTVWS